MCTSTFDGKEELRLHLVSHTGQMPHKVKKYRLSAANNNKHDKLIVLSFFYSVFLMH